MIRRLLFIALVVGIGYYYRADIKLWMSELTGSLDDISLTDVGTIASKLSFGVSAPEPLEVFKVVNRSELTAAGVIAQTNAARSLSSLPPLTRNNRLTQAAEAKVEDMFTLQYFEHKSPSGIDAAGLAKNAGYSYIIVGENLATGNFEDDADVVAAWMASPGHRANILNNRYTEIGVAVGRGTFEGRNVWMAVQEFGLPASACPAPSELLSGEINQQKVALDDLLVLVERAKDELDAEKNKRSAEYARKTQEYNELVDQYNELLAKTKEKIATYNTQVTRYNDCAAGE
jgi:uncharacterized protein YkwD